jgi:hypothetical protein
LSTEEHHDTLSSLDFTIPQEDLQYLNEYQGHWEITGQGPKPENFWLVTKDGRGHPVKGHLSPQQILDWGRNQGWEVSYVAPYGRHVLGAQDEVPLHEWITSRKRAHLEAYYNRQQ